MPKKILIEKLITRILFILAWFVFWIFCYFYYSKSDVLILPNSTNIVFFMALVVIIALPFGVTKIFQIIFSRTGDGVVVDNEVKTIPDTRIGRSRLIGAFKSSDLHFKQVVDVNVQRDDGKIIVRRFDDKVLTYYNIGDRVRIHKGINYFEKLDKSNDRNIVCLKCGHINDMEKDKCYHCGRNLYRGE